MAEESDLTGYYIAEMKAGRLRIVYGLTTPQIWTIEYRDGAFVKGWYHEYTDEHFEAPVREEDVRNTIEVLGARRIWGEQIEQAARAWDAQSQSSDGLEPS